jgi:hypothetical protein
MTGTLVPTGQLTVCCGAHRQGPLGTCCDPADCGPCCVECPTCPRCQFYERFEPGWRKQAAADGRRWRTEFWGDRPALAEIGAAMEWWDRYDLRSTTIRPQIAQIVRMVRRVREATWAQVM